MSLLDAVITDMAVEACNKNIGLFFGSTAE
jgi:hypothetical protein